MLKLIHKLSKILIILTVFKLNCLSVECLALNQTDFSQPPSEFTQQGDTATYPSQGDTATYPSHLGNVTYPSQGDTATYPTPLPTATESMSQIDIAEIFQTVPPCVCLVNPPKDTNVILNQEHVKSLMSLKMIDIVRKVSQILRIDYGIENDIDMYLPEGDFISLSIDKLLGKFTVDELLRELHVSNDIIDMANNYDQYHNMPIIDLLQMLIPELNQILMAQNMTIDQALNQFNLTTMDLSFIGLPLNLQELMDLNLYQASEFLNLSAFFSPEFNIEALSNMTILEAVGMIDFQSFGFPFDFTKLSIKDIVNLTDFTIFFDPEFNVQLLTSLPLIEVINKFEFIQEFTNTTVGDLFGLVNMEYLLSPDYNLQQLGGLSVSQLITIIDLNVLGMPLNIGGLTSLTVYDLLNSVNMTFLLDPELNVESLANNTIIDTLNTINIGEINVGDVTRLTITDLLAMTNTSFLLDPNFNVEHLSDLPLMDLLGMIDLSMFGMPMTVENLTQLTISEILTGLEDMPILNLMGMFNLTEVIPLISIVQSNPQMTAIEALTTVVPEFNSISVMSINQVLSMFNLTTVIPMISHFQNNSDTAVLDIVASLLEIDFQVYSEMTIREVLMSFNASDIISVLADIQMNPNMTIIGLTSLLPFPEVQSIMQMHVIDAIEMANLTELFYTLENIQSNPDRPVLELLTMIPEFENISQITLGNILSSYNLSDIIPAISELQTNPDMRILDILVNLQPGASEITVYEAVASLNATELFMTLSYLQQHPSNSIFSHLAHFEIFNIEEIKSMTFNDLINFFNLTEIVDGAFGVNIDDILMELNLLDKVGPFLDEVPMYLDMNISSILRRFNLSEITTKDIAEVRLIDVLNLLDITDTVSEMLKFVVDNSEMSVKDTILMLLSTNTNIMKTVEMIREIPQYRVVEIFEAFNLTNRYVPIYEFINKLVGLDIKDVVPFVLETFELPANFIKDLVELDLESFLDRPLIELLGSLGLSENGTEINNILNLVDMVAYQSLDMLGIYLNMSEMMVISEEIKMFPHMSLIQIMNKFELADEIMPLVDAYRTLRVEDALRYFNLVTEDGPCLADIISRLPDITIAECLDFIGQKGFLDALIYDFENTLFMSIKRLIDMSGMAETLGPIFYQFMSFQDMSLNKLFSFIITLIPEPCICAPTTTILTTTKQPDDIFLQVDKNIVFVLSGIMKDKSLLELAEIASNSTRVMSIIDKLTKNDWKNRCGLAMHYYKYLEDRLVKFNDQELVTLDRLNLVLPCKRDCQFDRLLSVPSNFSSDMQAFANNVLMHLSSDVSCRTSMISNYIVPPKTANDLINNLNQIGLLAPTDLKNFSVADSLNIAIALSSGNVTIDKEMAKNLGANIATDVSVTQVLSIASAIPLECFNNTSADDLVSSLEKMDTGNMDNFRKSFIANKIISSRSSSVIQNLLMSTADSTMINSIPSSMFTSLNISVSQIPAKNLPRSFMKKYSRDILSNSNLESITDLDTMAKILTGITASDLNEISNNGKVDTIMKMINASITSGIELSSAQRSAMLTSMVTSLQALNASSSPSSYLNMLTPDQITMLTPLFIEAPEEILKGFSSLSSFSTLVNQAVQIPTTDCCKYARNNRKLFAKYAIPVLTSNTQLTYSNFLAMGDCFASVLPIEYFVGMNETDFLSYFPSVGKPFQPDANETTNMIAKIELLAASQNDLETFVFQTLQSLSAYYPTLDTLNATSFRSSGGDLFETIQATLNPQDIEIQLCRFGLENDASLISTISAFQNSFVNAYISTLSSRRRKRSGTQLTCNDLNNLAGALNSLSTTYLGSISTIEFSACQTLLGGASNGWSSAQLSTLGTIAKTIYSGGVGTMSDSVISSLNSILLGYSSAELAQLVFTSLSSISALGALTGWTTDQLTNGLGVASQNYINSNGGALTSSMVNSMNNLVCGLSTTSVNTLTNSDFEMSVSALAQISTACPNIEAWYTKAKSTTTYGSTLYTSDSSISELGSVMAGISVSDLAQVSADSMSSLGTNVWNLMAVSTVNSLTTTQLKGLTTNQVSSIMNSPNYDAFSSAIKVYCQSVAFPTRSISVTSIDTSDNSTGLIRFSWVNLLVGFISAILLF